eukprot:2198490-Pyramimonas_sp.AAC.1
MLALGVSRGLPNHTLGSGKRALVNNSPSVSRRSIIFLARLLTLSLRSSSLTRLDSNASDDTACLERLCTTCKPGRCRRHTWQF